MPINITNENKNNLPITNEDRVSMNLTWDEAVFTWDDAGGSTWDNQRLPITNESKNNLSITNESKS